MLGLRTLVRRSSLRPLRLIAARLRPGCSAALWEDEMILAGSVPHEWAQDGYSVVPSVDGWARADRAAVLLADDSIRAVLALPDWGQAG